MTKQQEKCPYCHDEIGRPHYALLASHFYTSEDKLAEEALPNENS